MESLKVKYNEILARLQKGQKLYTMLDENNPKDKEKMEIYMNRIIQLLEEGDAVLHDLESFGTEVTTKEINNGFRI